MTGVDDAHFDMDLDHNFHESVKLFYNNLKHDRSEVDFLERPKEAKQFYDHQEDQAHVDPDDQIISDLEKDMGLTP